MSGDLSFDPQGQACGPYPELLNLFVVGDLTVGGRLFPQPGYIATLGSLTVVASLTHIEIVD